jgi:hypothetical protein
MHNMAFVNIVLCDRFVLNEFNLSLFVFLLGVVDGWPNEQVNASLSELEKIGGEFCLEVTAENRISLLGRVAIQANPVIS